MKRKTRVGVPNAVEQTPTLPPGLRELAGQRERRAVSYAHEKIAQERQFKIDVPNSEYPCVTITVPDTWPCIKIAPLFDVHIGSVEMDGKKFVRDILWLAKEPYALTFNGGDLWDNAIKASIASSFANDKNPNEQYNAAEEALQLLLPKMMFGLPGNHEDRTARYGDIDVSRILHENLGIPYSSDYMMASILWRGMKIRILAHHGTGAAATPGGQRNAARKDMPWAHSFDLYWTGHLHQALIDPIEVIYFDQESDIPVSKTVYSIISPSYVKYFGGYAAKKRLAPGQRGLTVVTVQPDGRLDTETHANGSRL
jgi:hypothetical protein